jgi:Flp pilus assembly protein TadB
MDDFETFRTSREKMDPSSRKLSEQQWQQAYSAYCSSRERVGVAGKSTSSGSGSGKKRRQSKKTSSEHASSRSGSRLTTADLRQRVREQSAYAELRMLVNFLAWGAIVVFILIAVVSMSFYTSVSAALVALLWGVAQVIGVSAARLLVQVLIDLPDIALYRSLQE